MPELEPRQERFCREYVIDYNGAQAAIRAGYSEKTARTQASDLLTRPHIQEEIAKLKEKQYDRLDINADKVLMETFRIASVDLSRAVDKNGDLLPLKEMPEDIRRAISSIEIEKLFEGRGEDREQVGTLTKVKFWEKTKALDLLGKHFKLWVERLELSGSVGIADALKAARARASK